MNAPQPIPPETAAVVPAAGALVAMPFPAEKFDHAERANFFHRLSREAGIVSIRAAIAAGVELRAEKREHPGGFQNWVKAKCAFGVRTAYNYIALAEKMLPDLEGLLYHCVAEQEEAIEAAATSTDSRTLTELYVEQGIVNRTPSNMGGAREGAGRPKLIAEGGITEGIRKAAVTRWGEVQRNAGYFLAHKFELALTLPQVRAAQKTVKALADALAHREAELQNGSKP